MPASRKPKPQPDETASSAAHPHPLPLPHEVTDLHSSGIPEQSVIPLFKGKNPGYAGWQSASTEEVNEKFWSWTSRAASARSPDDPNAHILDPLAPNPNASSPHLNFGIRLGPKFKNLCDIDLDSQQARVLAPYFLPETATFGRKSKGITHYLYFIGPPSTTSATRSSTASAATTSAHSVRSLSEVTSRRFLWDKRDEKSVLLEIRYSGQTMAPGSIHPDTQEPIEWSVQDPVIATVSPEHLIQQTNRLAAATLLLRDWDSGNRDELSLALTGSLLRAEWTPSEIDAFLFAITNEANDEEYEKRQKAERLLQTLREGGRVPGIPRLRELVSNDTFGRLMEWLDLASTSVVDEFNARFAVVQLNSSVLVMDESAYPPIFMNKESFALLHSNRILPFRGRESTADKVWLSSPERRQFKSVVFKPLSPLTPPPIHNPYSLDLPDYNLWRGFPLAPTPPSNPLTVVNSGTPDQRTELPLHDDGHEPIVNIEGWEMFYDHIYRVLCSCDQHLTNWILHWMAQRVQAPHTPPRSSIVMVGERGEGKGTFASIFGSLFGPHYLSVTNPQQFMGKFNAHMADKVLIFADEAVWGGDKVNEGILKVMISEDRRAIEAKGKDAFWVDNCTAYLIASNHDWVVPAGRHERRFLALRLSSARRGQRQYFMDIHYQMERNGGLSRLFHELINLPADEMQRHTLGAALDMPPRTMELAHQVMKNLTTVERFIHEMIMEGRIPSEIISSQLHHRYINWCNTNVIRYRESLMSFSYELKRLLPISACKKIRKRVGDQRWWAYRLHHSTGELQRFFDNAMGMRMPWSDD